MKKIWLLPALCFLLNVSAHGQSNRLIDKYPFDTDALTTLAHNLGRDDTIAPTNSVGGFRYMNTYSNKPVCQQCFEMAYPYQGKYALVKLNGKYGVIDRTGVFIVEPNFPRFQLFHWINYGIYFDQSHFFSFSAGKMLMQPEITCGEPASPLFYSYRKGTKFGLIYKSDTIKHVVFDSVIATGFKFAIVERLGKIGAVDGAGKTVLKFEYRNYAGARGDIYGIFALEKNGTWYYYRQQNLLFESKLEPAFSGGLLRVKINNRYNYLNFQGQLMLDKNYRWIDDDGIVAINEAGSLVFLLKGKREWLYY